MRHPAKLSNILDIINCAEEGASLITKQGTVKKKNMRICFNIKAAQRKWIESILKIMFEFVLSQMT